MPIHTGKVDSLSSPASAKEYNAKDCIKKFRIIFQPEYSRDEFGHRTTHLLRGAKAQELLP